MWMEESPRTSTPPAPASSSAAAICATVGTRLEDRTSARDYSASACCSFSFSVIFAVMSCRMLANITVRAPKTKS